MSIQNEQRLVVTLLLDYTTNSIVEDITPEMFTDRDCRLLYVAMLELDIEGDPVDLVSTGKQAGFSNYQLSEFTDLQAPSSGLIKYDCAEMVKEWQQREITSLLKIGAEGEPGARINEIKRKMDFVLDYSSNTAKTFKELMNDWRDNYLLWADGKLQNGLKTGYSLVDFHLRYRSGNLITIGARTGVGKTTFALNQAVNIARDGSMVGIISLEMSSKELIDKLFGIRSGIAQGDIYRHDQLSTVMTESARIEDLRIAIEAPLFNDAEKIFNLVRRQVNNGAKIVFIDYLQLMFHRGKFQNRNYEIGKITASLKILASELGIPIVILSQLKRKDGNPLPELSDLRDSGSIEQDSNIVLFIHDLDNIDNEMQCRIAKNRGGSTGRVKLIFKKEISLITQVAI